MNAYKEEIDIKIESLRRDIKLSQDMIDEFKKNLEVLQWIEFRVHERGEEEKEVIHPPKPRIGETIKLADIQWGEWIEIPHSSARYHRQNSGTIVSRYINDELFGFKDLGDLSADLDVVVIEDPTKEKEEPEERPVMKFTNLDANLEVIAIKEPTKDKEEPEDARIGKLYRFEDLEDGDYFCPNHESHFVYKLLKDDDGLPAVTLYNMQGAAFTNWDYNEFKGCELLVIAKPDWVNE